MVSNSTPSGEPNTDSTDTSRRDYLKSATVTAGSVVALAGCSGGGGGGGSGGDGGSASGGNNNSQTGSSGSEFADAINVTFYGGSQGKAFRDTVAKSFQKETGVKVNVKFQYTDWGALSKQKAGGGGNIHGLYLQGMSLYAGMQDDLVQPIRPENVPNLDNLTKKFDPTRDQPWSPGEKAFFSPHQYGGVGATRNADNVDKVEKWDDLMKSGLKNELSFPGSYLEETIAVAARDIGIQDFNQLEAGSDKMEKVWERIGTYNDYMSQWYDSATTMRNLLSNKTVQAGAYWYGRVYPINQQTNLNLKYEIPENGSMIWITGYAVPNAISEKERYTVERLINHMLDPEVNKPFSNRIRYATPFKTEYSWEKGNPDNEHIDKLDPWDPEVVANNMKQWRQRFQQVIQR